VQRVEQIRAGSVEFVLHTEATGGVLVINDTSLVRLSPVQFAFLALLSEQRTNDAGKHDAVCGYVSSPVLLCSLPWDTPHPDLNHLKQLVRRVRRRVGRFGLVVGSMSGLGYRLEFEQPHDLPLERESA
jgi:hypothetical protein